MFGMKQVSNDNGVTAKVGPAEQPQQQQSQPDAMSSGEPATPEEQAMYDMLVDNAMNLVTTDDRQIEPSIAANLKGEFTPDIIQMLGEVEPPVQPSPVDGLAVTAVTVTLFLDASAQESGTEIPDDVLFNAGSEIVEVLANLAEAAGIHEYSEEEMEGAFYRALDIFRTASPRVDQAALGEQFAEIANADKAGGLGQLLPGIQERMAA